MATGGGEFGYEDSDLDNQLDHDDEEQEVNTTQPFKPPVAASTSFHGGETIEMQTRQHEQTGLPETSYEETPLLGDWLVPEEKESRIERAKDFIRKRHPKVDFRKLGPIGFGQKSGNETFIVSFGPRGGETKIFKSGDSDFLKRFTDKNSEALGPRAEDIIAEDRDTIREEKQRLIEAENQLKQAEVLAVKREQEVQAMQELRQKNRENTGPD